MSNSTKLRIIEEGVQLIRRDGYGKTGISQILKAAGVPKGSFYYYFKSKEDFGIEVIDYLQGRIGSSFSSHLLGEMNANMSPLARLRRFFETFRTSIMSAEMKSGCGFGNVSQELAASQPAFREKLNSVYEYLTGIITLLLDMAVTEGELPKGTDTKRLGMFIFNSWEGALIFVKVRDDDSPLKLFEEYTFDRLLPALDREE